MTTTFVTRSAEETLALGQQLARRFGAGDCVALVGVLGSGKTVLVRGIARGLGVADDRLVCSPSYVLVKEYPGNPPIYHVDLYRVKAPAAELAELGLQEMLSDGLVVVEWADRAGQQLPRPHWRITIRPTARNRREFSLERVE